MRDHAWYRNVPLVQNLLPLRSGLDDAPDRRDDECICFRLDLGLPHLDLEQPWIVELADALQFVLGQ